MIAADERVVVWVYPLAIAFTAATAGLRAVFEKRNPGVAGASVASWVGAVLVCATVLLR